MVQPVRIGFLLIQRFSALGFLCASEPLRVTNRLGERTLFEWVVLSENGEPVTASNGMQIRPAAALDAHTDIDWLIICSGFEPLKYSTPALPRLLRRLAARHVTIGGLDTAAFILAQARLVHDLRVTVHWEASAAFTESFPDIAVSGELFEDHDRIFTCAGGTASIDFMLHRIARLHGATLARRVSEQFIHTTIRLPGAPQRLRSPATAAPGSRILARALTLMERISDRRLTSEELETATRYCARHVERQFRRHFGWGPATHHRKLRLAKARSLLRETSLPIADIASICGFDSRPNFCRAYGAEYGLAPSADRHEPERGQPLIRADSLPDPAGPVSPPTGGA
ncbi:GlxA family transcriptional regulator [Komagataeibacter sp. FNDCF1]|uniref:GlxA family transcriptional regulator n=1 Tax=Komagataeibacter sp. FNDCF1 TaxID=2878681 RepID=UPI001E29D956|nr:GlxA family transcriptional regulator [Komagataeibacter sp. FNDCF1]MCE2565126.1 GlxA family transcriptional regulator [Komagataeibacter sp. FNDCF1]